MDRYHQLFRHLLQKKEGAFIPFITLGDPTPEYTLKIVDSLIAGGADALELGIPFSDPLADGPAIQQGNLRAINAGTTPSLCFELLTAIRKKYPDTPVGLLLYANIVFNRGIDDFYTRCQEADVDSVLIGDVPIEESRLFRESAMRHRIAPVFICPPNASDDLMREIASHARGYVYLQSRPGVTGCENPAAGSLSHLVTRLREYNAVPAIQGFGIGKPYQVRDVISSGAAGAIAGSATVRLIEKYQKQPEIMLKTMQDYTREMKNATR